MDELNSMINELVQMRADLAAARSKLDELRAQHPEIVEAEEAVNTIRNLARELEEDIRERGDIRLAQGGDYPSVLNFEQKRTIALAADCAIRWAIDHDCPGLLKLDEKAFKSLVIHNPGVIGDVVRYNDLSHYEVWDAVHDHEIAAVVMCPTTIIPRKLQPVIEAVKAEESDGAEGTGESEAAE